MRLKELYKKEITKQLQKKLGIDNIMSVPRLSKVVINVGFGRQVKDKDIVEKVKNSLIAISGQKPMLTKSKKAISAFKIREDMVIGAMVTLRKQKMWDFVDKLVNVYFPRIRDFRGLNEKSIDKQGNLTVGFKDILAFPEIDVEDLEKLHGLEISISTNAKNYEVGLEFFRALGFPIAAKDIK